MSRLPDPSTYSKDIVSNVETFWPKLSKLSGHLEFCLYCRQRAQMVLKGDARWSYFLAEIDEHVEKGEISSMPRYKASKLRMRKKFFKQNRENPPLVEQTKQEPSQRQPQESQDDAIKRLMDKLSGG